MKKGCRKKRTLKKNYFNIKFFVCLHGDKIYNSEHWWRYIIIYIYIIIHIISTDEDPGLRIESFAVINLRGVSTNKTIIYFNINISDNN
jgi:hypothetical protein